MTRSRVSAIGLALVAAVALTASFIHLRALALMAGESQLTAALLPVSVDGLLLAAGGTMRAQAERGRRDAIVAAAFVSGVAATVAGNTYVGMQHGTLGALVAAWTPLAALLAFESWLRGTSQQVAASPDSPDNDTRTLKERVQALLAEQPELDPVTVAVRTGASESYARKLMNGNGHQK